MGRLRQNVRRAEPALAAALLLAALVACKKDDATSEQQPAAGKSAATDGPKPGADVELAEVPALTVEAGSKDGKWLPEFSAESLKSGGATYLAAMEACRGAGKATPEGQTKNRVVEVKHHQRTRKLAPL